MYVDHLAELGGLPAFDFPHSAAQWRDLPAADAVAWRIAVEGDDDGDWSDMFERFAKHVDISRVVSLIVGRWEEAHDTGPDGAVDALVRARGRMPALRHVFLGDIVSEQCEISWITHTDLYLVLSGLPRLETLGARGCLELACTPLRHERLRSLTVESGGMPAGAVRGIAACDFPSLVELDLWLGTSEYGGDCAVGDLAPFLDGTRLPALRSLALRNSEIQDEIAAACASAPVVARLEKLDLSMGVLTDTGVTGLLDGQPLTHLRTLDLHHHFLSDAMVQRIDEALSPAGVQLDLDDDDAREFGEYEFDGRIFRSVSVAE